MSKYLWRECMYNNEKYKIIMLLQYSNFLGLRLQRLSDNFLIDVASSEVEVLSDRVKEETKKWRLLKSKNIEVGDQVIIYDDERLIYEVVNILGYGSSGFPDAPGDDNSDIVATLKSLNGSSFTPWKLTSSSCKLYKKKGFNQLSMFDLGVQL